MICALANILHIRVQMNSHLLHQSSLLPWCYRSSVFQTNYEIRAGHLKGEPVFSKTHIVGRDVSSQELVDSIPDTAPSRNNTVGTWTSIQALHEIGHVVQNGQIMFNNDHVLLAAIRCCYQTTNELGHLQALLDIQKGCDLVKHVDVGVTTHGTSRGKSLELSTRQVFYLSIHEMQQLQITSIHFHHATLVTLLQEGLDRFATQTIDKACFQLWLGSYLELVLEDTLEVVLEIGASEIGNNIRPGRRVFQISQVRLDATSQNLQCG
mmetsp:Transcript_34135/g.53364  ORF Transcript_34135/g.53364 Transcript_34135/m.53364 type:complete len:266 (+) Transcript_34135:1037-1834(+)